MNTLAWQAGLLQVTNFRLLMLLHPNIAYSCDKSGPPDVHWRRGAVGHERERCEEKMLKQLIFIPGAALPRYSEMLMIRQRF